MTWMPWRRRAAEGGFEPPEFPRAGAPGQLPTDHGQLVTPTLWAVPGAAATWPAHAARFEETGLWPVVVESDQLLEAEELFPDKDWQALAERDAHDVLAGLWSSHAAGYGDPGPFPGLTPRGDQRMPATADALGAIRGAWGLALVPVTRPADVPALIGWAGPANHFSDLALVSAVLRSWEERFDAILVGLGFDTMWLAVRRPPAGAAVQTAAAENYAFCPDLVDQGVGSLDRLARELDGVTVWQYWWD